MSEQSHLHTDPQQTISNVPIENVQAGKHYDGTPLSVSKEEGPIQIVRQESDAGGPYLASPDGVFTISVVCDDLQLRLAVLRELRFFFNDPERSVQFLPKIKDALAREQQTNTTIPK